MWGIVRDGLQGWVQGWVIGMGSRDGFGPWSGMGLETGLEGMLVIREIGLRVHISNRHLWVGLQVMIIVRVAVRVIVRWPSCELPSFIGVTGGRIACPGACLTYLAQEWQQ